MVHFLSRRHLVHTKRNKPLSSVCILSLFTMCLLDTHCTQTLVRDTTSFVISITVFQINAAYYTYQIGDWSHFM